MKRSKILQDDEDDSSDFSTSFTSSMDLENDIENINIHYPYKTETICSNIG